MTELIYPELSYAVQGAFFDVHNQLRGFDLSEEGWERALLVALEEKGIPAQHQVEYGVLYGPRRVGRFFVDVQVDDKLLVELKVVENLLPIHSAQTITYLRVTGLKLGILVNFGAPRVIYQRIPNAFLARLPASPKDAGTISSSERLLYPELTEALRAALYTVHTTLGPGFMHMHYRRAVQIELTARVIGYRFHNKVAIPYRGRPIESREARLICVEGKLLLACVAVTVITPQMHLRMSQYLKLFGLRLGLIANFHALHLEIVTIRLPDGV